MSFYHVYDSDPRDSQRAAEHEAERQWHMTHVCSPETCGWRELSEAEVARLINEEQEGAR